jgi:hypothetical protein
MTPSSGVKEQPHDEATSPDSDDADDSDLEQSEAHLLTNEFCASPSSFTRPMKTEGRTDFNHPAAAEEEPIIWLPKDPLGLVHEIGRELTSHDILYSAEGAKIDSKCRVDVTMASPEEIRRNGGETLAI